jgi:hypothetical protein
VTTPQQAASPMLTSPTRSGRKWTFRAVTELRMWRRRSRRADSDSDIHPRCEPAPARHRQKRFVGRTTGLDHGTLVQHARQAYIKLQTWFVIQQQGALDDYAFAPRFPQGPWALSEGFRRSAHPRARRATTATRWSVLPLRVTPPRSTVYSGESVHSGYGIAARVSAARKEVHLSGGRGT